MYKPKHFKIQELVPPEIYNQRGEKAWQLLDDRLLISIDQLREEFGTATINNYHTGGARSWSGLRTVDSPYHSPTSQHTFGRAADILFNTPAVDVRQFIMNNPEKFPHIHGLECGVGWLHIDVRNYSGILTFRK